MNPIVTLDAGVQATLLGATRCSVATDKVATLREGLVRTFTETMSPNTLKQCDEQTLTALTAVGQVRSALANQNWANGGVIACPRRPGRKRLTESLTKFRIQGAWSTSPHIIPHTLLHSFSGLISQALGAHGPNMGVGGVEGAEAGVLTTAAAWLAGGDAEQLWLVWIRWDNEASASDGVCRAEVAFVERSTAVVGEPFWPTFQRLATEWTA